ncbi:hypothetical protein ACMD2_21321 [Ananas comosus]|uniref:Uncharacterized protein n=1 Tax=Ananas comosus TaxID=4615 RepID=A0A199UH48_ANACO|nr:hypothetical protein ACMD2_21321 [Ananas comosus]
MAPVQLSYTRLLQEVSEQLRIEVPSFVLTAYNHQDMRFTCQAKIIEIDTSFGCCPQSGVDNSEVQPAKRRRKLFLEPTQEDAEDAEKNED